MAKEESHSVLAAFRVHKKHEDPADQSATGNLIPVVMEATKRMSPPRVYNKVVSFSWGLTHERGWLVQEVRSHKPHM